ncbi:MAG: S1C family serine protease, partial [Candidatus Methylomirabilales bacterium]
MRCRTGCSRVIASAVLLASLLWLAATPRVEARSNGVGSKVIPAMVAKTLPSVVSITTRRIEQDEFNKRIRSAAMGSGVIVDGRGYVLTNEHVVRGAEVIKVTLTDGRSFTGELIGADRFTDLAVVKIPGTGFRSLPLGDSSRLRIGQTVVAVGSPLWIEGGPTVTVGVISGTGRSMEEPDEPEQATLHDLLQTDAAINSGNSGGPLLNLAGQVVGINTAVMESAHGIGFVIPINNAKPVYADLLKGRRVVRPSLGLVAVSLTPQLAFANDYRVERGALVVKVEPGTPAAAAGLRPDDVILAVGDEAVEDLHHYHAALFKRKPGDRVHLT